MNAHVWPDGSAIGNKMLAKLHKGDRMVVFGNFAAKSARSDWSMRVRGTVVPEESGVFQLALAQAGRARLLIDGDVVIDGFSNPPPKGGSDFFGQASQDQTADFTFERGVPVEMVCFSMVVTGMIPIMALVRKTSLAARRSWMVRSFSWRGIWREGASSLSRSRVIPGRQMRWGPMMCWGVRWCAGEPAGVPGSPLMCRGAR